MYIVIEHVGFYPQRKQKKYFERDNTDHNK